MYALDFEYDGRYLSDHGFVICTFGSQSDYDTISAGSRITFNRVQMHRGKYYGLAGTAYDEYITATFEIGRNPDKYEDLRMTEEEYRDLMRWLNRHEFLRFKVLGWGDDEPDSCYYDASFNVEKVLVTKVLYGLRLTMETNRPFGYAQERKMKFSVPSANGSFTLRDASDEIGYVYPDMTITCKGTGMLTIHNDMCDEDTVVKNCSNGEVLTIHGREQIITSSLPSHAIYNDFNFEFPKIGNTYKKRQNKITVSLPCDMEIRYTPIVKDTPE